MDIESAKSVISHLGRYDYARFAFSVLHSAYGDHLRHYDGLEHHAFVRDLSDFEDPTVFSGYQGVYIMQDIPFELFRNPEEIDVESPYIKKVLSRVNDDFGNKFFLLCGHGMPYKRALQAIYFIDNLHGFSIDFYRDIMLPKYSVLVEKVGLFPKYSAITVDNVGSFLLLGDLDGHIHLGNVDTVLANNAQQALNTLGELLPTFQEGISIEVSSERPRVCRYAAEKYLTSGVGRERSSLCNPVYISSDEDKNAALAEFEDLLSRNPTEAALEHFIARYYQDIFGLKYDRIETQVWLRFPELDINNRERRLDVFLRNSIKGDWELFELKRIVPLTSTYRDVPTLSTEIYKAIEQVSNYQQILLQQSTKDQLAREGIEYCEPELHLVVGKKPEISHFQWRRLVANNTRNIKLLTYDELLDEMRIRLQERTELGRSPLPIAR